MGGDFPIDLIIFAAIALFLVLRLGNVLGKRTGHQKRPEDMFPGGRPPSPQDGKKANDTDDDDADDANVIHLPGAKDDETEAAPESPLMQGPAGAGLAKIRIADPSFDPDQFVQGANMAFEMIVHAFAEGDTNTLKPLLANDVYDNFATAISSRAEQGHRMEDTLVGIDSSEILEADMQGPEAQVTVKFVTKQVNVTYDREDRVIAGEPATVITVTDIWTFARDTRSRDPNWALTATRTSN